MPDSNPHARIVLTTAATPEEANRLARILVEEHLAACATLIPAVQSIYRWQGKVESSTETLCSQDRPRSARRLSKSRLLQLHSYETPEFLVLTSSPPATPTSNGCRPACASPIQRILDAEPVWYSWLGSLLCMRWLIIALLVSLGALLFAAAGVARHI